MNMIDQQNYLSEFRPAPAAVPVADLSVGDLLRKVWQRRWLLASVVLGLMLLAAAATLVMTPIYAAKTSLLIGSRDRTLNDIQAAVSSLTIDAEGMASEVAVLTSEQLAGKVVDRLGLIEDPEFNAALKAPSPVAAGLAQLGDAVAAVKARLGLPAPPPPSEAERHDRTRVEVIESFLDKLSVANSAGSWVITVGFRSEDPKRAAEVANTLADAYIQDQLDAKYEATRKGAEWLAGKVAELRRNVVDAEKAAEAFRNRSGLLSGSRGTLIEQQISDLNAQLIVARTARAELESRLAQIQRLARSPAGAVAATEVLQSPTILDLTNQETAAKRGLAQLAEELGPRHPRIVSARAEVADIQAKIAVEIRKIVAAVESDLGTARGREQRLEAALQQLKGRLAEANTADVQLRALEREVDANRSILEAFLARSEQLRSQMDGGVLQPDARIIARASTPIDPAFPPTKIVLAIALVLSVLTGLILIFVLEQLERGFRDSVQLQQATGVRTLSLVPRLASRRKAPSAIMIEQPNAMFSESIRSLSTRLLIAAAGAPLKRILIASSLPNEGKTTIAACLARARAVAGQKVVLIEGDLRQPSLHRTFGNSRDPGLVDLLLGQATLDDVLYRDEASGAFVIPAGRSVSDPATILAAPQLRDLLDTLAADFDTVILDSPPLMVATDALVLSVEADFTVFVVRWGKTSREVAALALARLNETRRGQIAAVLSMVNPRRQAEYSGGDAGYFYKDVRRYYAS